MVGVGNLLRIYDIGKKKLLRKCESKLFPTNIVKLETQGDRILVTDAQESILYVQYRHYDNLLIIFADDFVPRWTTASTMLDYDTVAGGDRFGNIFVNRLPADISKEMDEDSTGSTALFERGFLNAAPHKINHLCEYHLGETITSINKASIVSGGRQVLVYTSFMGRIGILIPFPTKDDFTFFQMFEMIMRQETPSLCGRDHLSFRGYYVPVRNIVDGDLCEQFNLLANETKRNIASQLDRNTSEVAKKLEDIRTRVAF